MICDPVLAQCSHFYRLSTGGVRVNCHADMIVMTMHSARSRRLGVDYSVFRCTCMMSSTSERADFCLHISPGNVR